MPTSKDSKERMAAEKAAEKEERARDGARAMQEYRAERVSMLAKTARLRALRLAAEAAEPPAAKKRKTPSAAKPKTTR